MPSLLTGQNVRVTYGAHSVKADVAGLTVAQVHLIYSTLFTIGGDCKAFVNGKPAEDDATLMQGDRVEYMKIAGQKGQDYWSKREFMRLTSISEKQWEKLRQGGLRAVQLGDDYLMTDAECRTWVQRLVFDDDTIERAAAVGKAGRKNSTADIAEFANARRPHKTWKEILGEWRTAFPNDTRVKNAEQIQEAWRRRYRKKKS
jgi:hypothetical protein